MLIHHGSDRGNSKGQEMLLKLIVGLFYVGSPEKQLCRLLQTAQSQSNATSRRADGFYHLAEAVLGNF